MIIAYNLKNKLICRDPFIKLIFNIKKFDFFKSLFFLSCKQNQVHSRGTPTAIDVTM